MQIDNSAPDPVGELAGSLPILEIERIFDAPRERVFAAWADAERMVKWMGPDDYPAVAFEQDLRVGGTWRGTLRPVAGGKDLHQGGRYLEVEPPAKLVFTFQWYGENHEDGPGVPTIVSIDFFDEGIRTRMRFRQSGLKSIESATGHRAGWRSTFNRLEAMLRKPDPQSTVSKAKQP